MKGLALATALLAFSAFSFAQAPASPGRDRERADIFNCDRLSGVEKERCLRDERRADERAAQSGTPRGSCDVFIGPERERCLQQGGTVEASARTYRSVPR
ncbi:MAG: hypothetical protein ACREUE_19485 [Panacagrimonas sp.]